MGRLLLDLSIRRKYVHLEVNAQKPKKMSERLINAGMAGIMKVKFCFALGHYLEEVFLFRKGLVERRQERN